jgi:hypothetical protein
MPAIVVGNDLAKRVTINARSSSVGTLAPFQAAALVPEGEPDDLLLPPSNKNRKSSVSHEGRFTTKRQGNRASISLARNSIVAQGQGIGGGTNLNNVENAVKQMTVMHRRISTVEYQPEAETSKDASTNFEEKEEAFWDPTDTHHMLPVFASARAYVPASFMSLLVQSFYGVLTPLICEKLVCGQNGQSVLQIALPPYLEGRRFLDLYRIFSYNHVTHPDTHTHTTPSRLCIFYVFVCFIYDNSFRSSPPISSVKTLQNFVTCLFNCLLCFF